MSDWFRRLQNSRRARNATFAAIGIMTLGSCGGTLLANYTVAGMNTLPYSDPQSAQADWRADDPEWMREATVAVSGEREIPGFSSDAETASDTVY